MCFFGRLLVALTTDMCHTFPHQPPNFVVNRISGSAELFGRHTSGEISTKVRHFPLKELDCFTSTEWCQNVSFPSQLF